MDCIDILYGEMVPYIYDGKHLFTHCCMNLSNSRALNVAYTVPILAISWAVAFPTPLLVPVITKDLPLRFTSRSPGLKCLAAASVEHKNNTSQQGPWHYGDYGAEIDYCWIRN